jgi:hypothetical protein
MDLELRRIWTRLEEGEDWLIRGGSDMGDPRYTSLGHRLGQAVIVTVEEEMCRVQRVRLALNDSGPVAERMIAERLAGIELSTIWSILIQAVKDVAFYLGGSVALGTVGGAVVGAIFGGVGAMPGAYVGGSIGAEVGGLILGFLGLKCLAEGLIDTIPEAVRCYRDGVMQAWGANHWDHQYGCSAGLDGNINFAAAKIARGHVLLIVALLMAMVAYLTRGKGNRSQLLKAIRESKRLGPRIAEWLEKNQQKLAEHPSLRVRERPLAASEESAGKAMTPSKIKAAKEGGPQAKTETPPKSRAAENEPKEMTGHEKGAHGERIAHDKMVEKGYEPLGKTDGKYEPGKNGIDGVYKNPSPPPDYVVTEAKYKGAARLDKDLADGTNQMDDRWVNKRLEDKVGREEAENIADAMKEGRVEKWLIRVEDDGTTSATKINAAGSPIRGNAGKVAGF